MSLNVEETLQKLTNPQKIQILSGVGWWHTAGFPHAKVPALRMSDGPNGVRGTRHFNGVPSSCFPASTGLGASFDIDLAHRVGEGLGDEARAKSCHILLAPTVNTQRSPLGGRGFESFSEDPNLNGTVAAAYINGLQSKGVSATIKHFAANDQEFQRFSSSSDVSERALREIYLKPFQLAIKHSKPWALMTAYNRINGLHASEDKRLLDDILRKEWGWKGLIMSDWNGTYSTVAALKAGLDLEMPGPTVMRGRAALRALMSEKLFVEDLDERVRNVLELVNKAIASGIPFDGPENSLDTPAQRALLRTAAADAVVVLKNTGLLPITPAGIKKIAVIGPNSKPAMASGGGSAHLLAAYTVSPLQGIRAAAKEHGIEVEWAIGANTYKYPPLLDPHITRADGSAGALMEFWNEKPAEDYLSKSPKEELKPSIWSSTTSESNCVLLDGVDASIVDSRCFSRYTTTFTPDQDGPWEFGLSLAGRGNFFLDDKLILDLASEAPPPGDFMRIGSAEVRTVVPGLKAGKPYRLEVRLSNIEYIEQGPPHFPSWGGFRLGGMPVVEEQKAIEEAVALAKASDVVILVIGLNHEYESEGFDRPDMELPGATNKLVTEVIKANPKTVVVNQSGTPVAMPWVAAVDTLVQAFFGGNELGNGLADVLFGKVNASGKLPLTFPQKLQDSPSYLSFSKNTNEYGRVAYNEGIFVGYRGYESRGIVPLFPFGHGLSYSTFEYSSLKISQISAEGNFEVSFTLKNTSKVDGREISQVYISDPQSALPRPAKELKGFAKTALKGGESKTVTIKLDREALGYYDHRKSAWVAESGKFGVLIGASSVDIRLQGETELAKTLTWVGL